MPTLALSAVGQDRPGIVAAVTGALAELGCNLADSTMSLLGGHFAMVLLVDGPAQAAEVDARLDAVARALDLVVAVREVASAPPDEVAGDRWSLSVYGADHPGIVAAFAGRLAERGANVTDLSCKLTSGARPVYVMLAEIALPEGLDAESLTAELRSLAEEVGVDATFAPIEVETL